jgi:hypothetical protein
MKNLFFIAGFLLVFSTGQVFSQLQGRTFISGSAGIGFNQVNPANAKNFHGYSYQFDALIGKFKTENRAAGWRLSNRLEGSKRTYSLYQHIEVRDFEKSGVTDVGFGIGRVWQFYKHFNEKVGMYAGPEISLGYTHGNRYSVMHDRQGLERSQTAKFSFYAGLHAGIYYKLSEKWWVLGSLEFSEPFFVDYTVQKNSLDVGSENNKTSEVRYRFTPVFSVPAMGFGLRYFCSRSR